MEKLSFVLFFPTSTFWSCVNVPASVSICEKEGDQDKQWAWLVWTVTDGLFEKKKTVNAAENACG